MLRELCIMPCADIPVDRQPEPAAWQAGAKPSEAIIVRPATSALPCILCNTAANISNSQALPQAETALCVGAGSKRKASADPQLQLSRQLSSLLTLSASDSTPVSQLDCGVQNDVAVDLEHKPSVLALSNQAKKQASFNVITSGEYSRLTIRQQPSIKATLPSPFAQQADVTAIDVVADQAGLFGRHSQNPYWDPFGSGGHSDFDVQPPGSYRFDSSHLPACKMPDFEFEADNADIAQHRLHKSGFDPHLQHAQLGVEPESAAHGQAGCVAAQSKPWVWCNIMAQGLELTSRPAPGMADLSPMSEMPSSPCTSWEQQAWQALEHEPQYLQSGDQQQQLQPALAEPFAETAICSMASAADMGFTEGGDSNCGAEDAWWMLPQCSVDNKFQADAALLIGECKLQRRFMSFPSLVCTLQIADSA